MPIEVKKLLTMSEVSRDVFALGITSTNGSRYGGFIQCVPMTLLGFLVADASALILKVEVLDAKIV